jgi:hypothetical protein
LIELGKVASNAHLVFAPMPTASPSLQLAMDILAQLQQSPPPSKDDDDAPRNLVLFLSDWSARVCNACQADIPVITAYYQVLLASLRALDSSLMSQVQVIWQSEAILADPSNYWISVINVGRHFSLARVMGSGMADSDCVGNVIARLMKVADVVGVEPKSLALMEHGDSLVEKELVEEFYQAHLKGLTAPSIALTQGPLIRLQVERESEGLVTENDEYFLFDDPKVSDNVDRLCGCSCLPTMMSLLTLL